VEKFTSDPTQVFMERMNRELFIWAYQYFLEEFSQPKIVEKTMKKLEQQKKIKK
jgi:hypothetical protein